MPIRFSAASDPTNVKLSYDLTVHERMLVSIRRVREAFSAEITRIGFQTVVELDVPIIVGLPSKSCSAGVAFEWSFGVLLCPLLSFFLTFVFAKKFVEQ